MSSSLIDPAAFLTAIAIASAYFFAILSPDAPAAVAVMPVPTVFFFFRGGMMVCGGFC